MDEICIFPFWGEKYPFLLGMMYEIKQISHNYYSGAITSFDKIVVKVGGRGRGRGSVNWFLGLMSICELKIWYF